MVSPEKTLPDRRNSDSSGYVRNNHEFEIKDSRGSLVSVGVGGGLTSRQIDIMILDDVYKDAKEAWSPVQRANVSEWYSTVVETRLHNESKVLIVFTRWHENDLGGELLRAEPEKWDVLKLPAIKQNKDNSEDKRNIGQALWPERHSLEKLLEIQSKKPTTFENLYQQDPQPQKGMLYSEFKTYNSDGLIKVKEANKSTRVEMYCDVADGGGDYLCSVVYLKTGESHFVLDVIYSLDGTETTERQVADQLLKTECNQATFESNNAGKIFGRNVKRIYHELGGKKCAFSYFTQRDNKESRIFSNAHTVNSQIIMPDDWFARYPKFYLHYYFQM
jgi:predicted phage terminase large subunit-like protein